MDWSNLGEGPAGMISDLLLANDVADYVRFRAVCRPWRQCTADPRAQSILDRRFLPRKWIMLREKVADPERRRLLNISTGQFVQAHLPELRGHDVFPPTAEGLLVLLNTSTYAVRLLNPLTRQVSDLPPATPLHPHYRGAGIHAAYLREDFNVSCAGIAGDTTVAVIFDKIKMLAVAKLGDEQWTLVEQGTVLSAISFAGRFYCITDADIEMDLDIKMVDTTDNQPPQLVLAAEISHQFPWAATSVHLLGNDGDLILLCRTSKRRVGEVEGFTAQARYFMEYKLSRVDLDARKTQPIRDLGGRALFVGSIRAISVSPLAFPALRNDSVYVCKDHVMGNELESIGPYKIVDGTSGNTWTFDPGSGVTEACSFDNGIVPRDGPHSIVHYLSKYVTRETSASYAQEYASPSYAQEYT